MKYNTRRTLTAFALATVFTLFPFMYTASAASQCKGLDEKACGTQDKCSWINSYKTKKGKTINAYCRTKPVKKPNKDASKSSKPPKSGSNG